MLHNLVSKVLLILAFSGSISKGCKEVQRIYPSRTYPTRIYPSRIFPSRFSFFSSRIPPTTSTFSTASWTQSPPITSKKRGVTNLLGMAASFIDCPNAIPIKYGCWCGLTIPFPASHGPVDYIDSLCKVHDYCYDDALKSGCSAMDEYVLPYQWEESDAGTIECAKNQARCQRAICRCDKKVVEGLVKYTKKNGCLLKDPGCPTS